MKLKINKWLFLLGAMGLVLILSTSCTKETTPEPSTCGSPVFNPNIIYGSMTDGEGNTYKTVTIGTQTWMAENLKVTKYNDSTVIPNVTDKTAWRNLTTAAVCTYNNTTNADTIKTYGRLYNWYAVNTGKLCPAGWHIPSSTEWGTLSTTLGGYEISGGAIKETGTTHWNSPNTQATNTSGFTVLPAGGRYADGAFGGIGGGAYWWSSTELLTGYASSRGLDYSNSLGGDFDYKVNGFSVRCVRD
jgi:uncharacterized protein (TIGR02145 family)